MRIPIHGLPARAIGRALLDARPGGPIPSRRVLTSLLSTATGRRRLMSLMPDYWRTRTDDPMNQCHNDMRDFLQQVCPGPKKLLVDYPAVFESSLNRPGRTIGYRDVWPRIGNKRCNDWIETDKANGKTYACVRGYGARNVAIRRFGLKPGMIIHRSRALSGGRFGKKHWIMWLGRLPGLGREGCYLDSLSGKIHAFSDELAKGGQFWRITRIRDPWMGREQ